MYFNLAIVLDRDIKNGSFWPAYVLCAANTTSETRSGWRVVRQFNNKKPSNLPKVLVTSIYGHQDMIDYLSTYRTQDGFKKKHYYVSGSLCWFETNQYGDPTGAVFYVKKIPDLKMLEIPRRQRSYKKIFEKQKKTIKEKWIKEKSDLIQL